MSACAVCDADLGDPVYRSSSTQALTSLCTILDQSTIVYSCPRCGHLQTPPIGDLEAYYSTAYRILLESEEEDQIYAVVDGERVYRADHQAATLLDRVELPPAARVLDYGAAKGATMRKVRDARPDVDLHFFDVSDMYADYWRKIVDDEAWATFERPANWSGSFDAVASFFMLEHVERPQEVVGAMFDLLRPGGVVYAVVPNPFVNVGDFVVVDHTNHFTRPSLDWLFAATGFDQISIDADAHSGAWVLSARRPTESSGTTPPEHQAADVVDARARAEELSAYWSASSERVAEAEAEVAGRPLAIYGAGFYGSFIRATLAHPEEVVAFVDQNPHLQGTVHDGRPVVAPADLDPAVTDVLVGLNPLHARAIIGDIEAWRDRALELHYL